MINTNNIKRLWCVHSAEHSGVNFFYITVSYEMSALTILARLERADSGTSWGFRLAGGKDFGAPLTVQKVMPGSLAAKCGLEIGDEIKMIGLTLTEGLRHSEAQQLISKAGNLVELQLERGGSSGKQMEKADSSSFHSDVNSNRTFSSVQNQCSSLEVKQVSRPGASSNDVKHETSATCADAAADRDFPPPPPPPEDFPKPPALPSAPPPTTRTDPEEQEDSDVPRFEGRVDRDGLQSRSFKLLMSAMDSGEDISKLKIQTSSPARNLPLGQKPAIAVKPNLQKDGPVVVTKPNKSITADTRQQYNSPIGLYSASSVAQPHEDQTKHVHEIHAGDEVMIDAPVERKTIVVPSKKTTVNISVSQEPAAETMDVPTERKKIVIPSSKLLKSSDTDASRTESTVADSEMSNGKKKYFPSDTMKLIQDQESGRPQIQINPKTGAAMKMNQSKKLIQLEQTLEGGFGSGPPVSTSYKIMSAVAADPGTKPDPITSGTSLVQVIKSGNNKKVSSLVEASKIPVCAECGTSIRGPYVTAMEKTWCPEHFVCAYPSCHSSLVDRGFMEDQGKLYCEQCFEQHFAEKCGKCAQGIIGETVSALQQKFHPNCFMCSKCHLPIAGGLFHTENGEIYCDKDWSIMFRTKCYGCQFPIDDGDHWVDALSRMWHSDCFKCVLCQINLDGQSFYAKNGKPYCKKHGLTA